MQPLKKGVQLAPSVLQPRASNDNDGRLKRSAAIGELFGGVRIKTTRSFQPVRRNSYYANDERVARIWQPIASDTKEAWRVIRFRTQAAQAYDRDNKQPGKKNGPLGHVGIEVLSQLYRMVDFRTGRLEPSIETLCSELKRSRGAVVAALKRLKHHGFVDWIRRAEPTGNGGAGPQIKQITNAYWLCLPQCAAAFVGDRLGTAPPPDCELAHHEKSRAELESMLAQLGLGDQGAMLAEDSEMAELLRRLGNAVSKDSASSLSGQNPA